jgi:hypothetical protein
MKKIILTLCTAALIAACSQKQGVVEVPVTKIDVEQLNKQIDYNMDVTGLGIGDLRVLRHAPAARQGFPFKDAYLRGVYESTTWYDSLMWKFDESVDFKNVKEREGESWRDFYYRASDETGAVKYTDEEQAFMKRLKALEDELMKQNFDVAEGLRVNMQNLINPTQLKDFDSLLCQQLAQNGFAIVPAGHEQLFHVYEQNDYNQFPSFVTTDLYLQLYHLYVDCLLREMEEHSLQALMTSLVEEMYGGMHSLALQGETEQVRRMAHHDAVYFSIAYELLTGKPIGTPDEQQEGRAEIEKVMKSENDFSQFIGDYDKAMFAYSLFRPRGHYTRSEKLQRYFRGMMWLQSVPFGVDNSEDLQQAVVMAHVMNSQASAQRIYQQVNEVLTYLMGQPDNLSIVQVQAELKKTDRPIAQLIADADQMATLKKTLNEMGEKQTRIRPKFERTSHNKVCLMPQRYQPDAEVLQEMVDYDSPQTLRATPKGLDFFAAMGVSAAEQILIDEGQKWKDFKPMLTKMKQRMGETDWQETIATQWMNALKTINDKGDKGTQPYFMVTPEWELKDLNAALASWAELKHDAILYAKQPMGAECGGGGLPDPVVKGYVEPNVGFWKKAAELLENTQKVLKQQGMLTDKIANATERISEEVQFLLRISKMELEGKALSDEEYDQLQCVGATFENISLDLIREPDQYLMGWSDVQGADRKVALVADVYTANADNNPDKSILFEAVGNADEIYVVVEIDGYLYLTRGAVFSYREFTQPIDVQRLTDEEWQQLLEKNPRKGVPTWMERIIVPMKQKVEVNEEFFYSSGC